MNYSPQHGITFVQQITFCDFLRQIVYRSTRLLGIIVKLWVLLTTDVFKNSNPLHVIPFHAIPVDETNTLENQFPHDDDISDKFASRLTLSSDRTDFVD